MSNYKQISAANIAYTQINHGCLPKILGNAIAQTAQIDPKTGLAKIKAAYYGGDQLGQVDYHMLNSFDAKTTPVMGEGKKGEYDVDFNNSGAIWKCPVLRRDLKRLNSGLLGIVYSPHPSSKWNLHNYKDPNTTPILPEPEEKAHDVKYANLKVPASYDQVPMLAELCKKNRSGKDSDNVEPPHNGNYGVAFLDGHVESCVGKKGYLHWCVGCDDHGDVKYTEKPDRGVLIRQ